MVSNKKNFMSILKKEFLDASKASFYPEVGSDALSRINDVRHKKLITKKMF